MTEAAGRYKLRSWTQKEGLGSNKVKALAIACDGTVWAGTTPGGVSRLDPATGKIRQYGREAGLKDDRVIAVLLDPEERLWVSTGAGLFRSTPVSGPVRFEMQILPGGDEQEMFFRFCLDHLGRIWAGASGWRVNPRMEASSTLRLASSWRQWGRQQPRRSDSIIGRWYYAYGQVHSPGLHPGDNNVSRNRYGHARPGSLVSRSGKHQTG